MNQLRLSFLQILFIHLNQFNGHMTRCAYAHLLTSLALATLELLIHPLNRKIGDITETASDYGKVLLFTNFGSDQKFVSNCLCFCQISLLCRCSLPYAINLVPALPRTTSRTAVNDKLTGKNFVCGIDFCGHEDTVLPALCHVNRVSVQANLIFWFPHFFLPDF